MNLTMQAAAIVMACAFFTAAAQGDPTTKKAQQTITLSAIGISATEADPPCGTDDGAGSFPPGYALCGHPCVDLPVNAKIKKVELFSYDPIMGKIPCTNGGECQWSRWWGTPEVYPSAAKITVCGNFKNWSNDRQRTGTMVVTYEVAG